MGPDPFFARPPEGAGTGDGRPPAFKFEHGLFVAALSVATLAFGWAVSRSLVKLLGIVPDDTFYYLKIAQNLAAHGQSTFDGLHPANGYHPGWMALMTLSALFVSDSEALLRVCIGLAFVCHVGSAVLLTKALGFWIEDFWAYVAGACWLLNPFAWVLLYSGVEGAFYILSLTIAFLFYSRRIAHQQGADLSTGDVLGFAACLALCFYGRTEASVFAAMAIVFFALSRRAPLLARFRLAIGLGTAFAVCVSPWFLFSYLATGRFTQVSGAMKILWGGGHGQREPLEVVVGAFHYLGISWLMHPFVYVPGMPKVRLVISSVLFVILVALLIWGWRRRPESELGAYTRGRASTRSGIGLALVLLIITLLTGSIYGLMFSDQQEWYRAQPSLILFAISFALLATLAPRLSTWQRNASAVGAVLGWGALLGLRLATLNPFPWQRDVYASQQRFEEMVPAGEPIGCFNAGIPGYFSKRTIINLDGLVNNVVYQYYKDGTVDRFLAAAKIRYIADESLALDRGLSYAARVVPTEVVAEAPLREWPYGNRFLWKVGAEARPRAREQKQEARAVAAAP
jgi:hypothetical protein